MSLLAKLKELIGKSVITDQKIDNVMKMESVKTDELIHGTFSLIQKYGPMFKKEGKIYVFGLYGPTYSVINKVLIPKIERFCQKFNINYDLNKSESKIYLRELGAVICLVNMENPEKIRGHETADAMIDKLDALITNKAGEVLAIILSRNRLKKPDGKPNTCGVTTLNSFIENVC